MAHDHRGRRIGRPWMHDVEDMRGANRAWGLNDEEGYVSDEDLAGMRVYTPRRGKDTDSKD